MKVIGQMTMMTPSAFSVKNGIQSPPKAAAPDVTSESTIHVRVSTAMILRTSTSDLNAYLKVLELNSDLFLFSLIPFFTQNNSLKCLIFSS